MGPPLSSAHFHTNTVHASFVLVYPSHPPSPRAKNRTDYSRPSNFRNAQASRVWFTSGGGRVAGTRPLSAPRPPLLWALAQPLVYFSLSLEGHSNTSHRQSSLPIWLWSKRCSMLNPSPPIVCVLIADHPGCVGHFPPPTQTPPSFRARPLILFPSCADERLDTLGQTQSSAPHGHWNTYRRQTGLLLRVAESVTNFRASDRTI